jgi:uncharacterized RDD family membrane protein YckC
MKTTRSTQGVWLGALLLLLFGWSAAESANLRASEEEADTSALPRAEVEERDFKPDGAASHADDERERHVRKWGHEVVKFGEDFVLEAGESAENVVVIAGNATIRGMVRRDFVVVAGSAVVDGSLGGDMVVVMGSATLGPKARVEGDAVVVGGRVKADSDAVIEGARHEVSLGMMMPDLSWVGPWFRSGVMMARPLPPQIAWAWAVAAFFLILYLFLFFLFPRPVKACADELESRPVASFFSGILLFLLLGPLLLLLIMSIAGILAVPIVFCALLGAILFGKVAVYTYTGQQVGRQIGSEALQRPFIGFCVGTVIYLLLYMVPLVGVLVWLAVLPLGVGAALLAAVRSMRNDAPGGPFYQAPVMANLGGLGVAGVSSLTGEGQTSGVAYGGDPTAGLPSGPGPGLPPLNEAALPRAGFWIRFWATFIDAVLIFWLGTVLGPVVLLLWIAYHVALWALKGTTVGGVIFGLKVVRLDGRPVDMATALVRSLSSILSAIVLFVGFFWVGWSRDRQAWHDRIAGTVIVHVPKGMSLV